MKRIVLLLLLIFIFCNCSINVYAQEDELPEEFGELLDELPDDVKDSLPDELFEDDAESLKGAVNKILSWDYIFDTVLDLIGINIKEIGRAFALICSVLVLSALLNALSNSIHNEATAKILRLFSDIIVISSIIKLVLAPLEKSEHLLENMKLFVNTLSPVICGMYAMGGNISSALVHNYGLIVFLSLFENICILSINMILGICLALTLASSFVGYGNLLGLSSAIKKGFTFFVGFMMLLFTTIISTQGLLASKADSLSTKTAKMLATQMIPVVGGTIGESLKTAGASVEYLRSTVGVVLIVILILLILPTIISIFLYRTMFIVSNAFACLIGCQREGNVLIEISDVFGYSLAILSISALTILFLLTIFARCASPLN